MNFHNRKWQCPICAKPCKIEDLYIDEYFQTILSSVADSASEVSIVPDATWSFCPQTSCSEEDSEEYNLPLLPQPQPYIVDLTLDD